ncbi:MAG: Holliday junction resolvase RuvX [Oliverpabstia sp.]
MRILGLDYGSKTVGVAVSDPLGLTAQGVEIIRRKSENKLRQTLARIEELAAQYQVEKIVLGFPKNMNNTLGDRAEKSLELKETLERRTGLDVVMWDERLTTVSANRVLMETGVRRENRKEHVDEIAAIFILQGYLDYLYNTSKIEAEASFSAAEEESSNGEETGRVE